MAKTKKTKNFMDSTEDDSDFMSYYDDSFDEEEPGLDDVFTRLDQAKKEKRERGKSLAVTWNPEISMMTVKVLIETRRQSSWRTVRIPATLSLENMHKAIQCLFLWEGRHAYRFTANGKEYGPDETENHVDEGHDTKSVRMADILKRKEDSIKYTYDSNTGWDHRIILEDVEENEDAYSPTLMFLDGKGKFPGEEGCQSMRYDEAICQKGIFELNNEIRKETKRK